MLKGPKSVPEKMLLTSLIGLIIVQLLKVVSLCL